MHNHFSINFFAVKCQNTIHRLESINAILFSLCYILLLSPVDKNIVLSYSACSNPEDQNDKVIRQHQSCVRLHIPRGISEGECRAPGSSEINSAIVSKTFYSVIF